MNEFNSSMIAAYELPIVDAARHAYNDLYMVSSAKELCEQLLHRDRIPELTDADYECIAAVAAGGMWPVPDSVYDNEQWNRDKHFNAVPGQEISESIYSHMFNVLPVMNLRHGPRTVRYEAGFLCSEPVCGNPSGRGMLYSAYGKRGDHYYYIGLLPGRD